MATWTTLPDATLEPGKPIRSIDVLALRDNPVAIAEGASGAPRIEVDGLGINAVLLATARDGSAGSIGTYVFAGLQNGTTAYAFGSTIAGSNLMPTSAVTSGTLGSGTFALSRGSVLSGTWRCMGNRSNTIIINTFGDVVGSVVGATLWLRIA